MHTSTAGLVLSVAFLLATAAPRAEASRLRVKGKVVKTDSGPAFRATIRRGGKVRQLLGRRPVGRIEVTAGGAHVQVAPGFRNVSSFSSPLETHERIDVESKDNTHVLTVMSGGRFRANRRTDWTITHDPTSDRTTATATHRQQGRFPLYRKYETVKVDRRAATHAVYTYPRISVVQRQSQVELRAGGAGSKWTRSVRWTRDFVDFLGAQVRAGIWPTTVR